jgi:hypothetical protein
MRPMLPNDPSSATAATRHADGNRDGPPPLDAMMGRWYLNKLKLLFMVVEKYPTLRIWPDRNIIRGRITKITPVLRENLPTDAKRTVGRPRNGNNVAQATVLRSQPRAAVLV